MAVKPRRAIIEVPESLRQGFAEYVSANPQASARIQGFLEGRRQLTAGTCRLEITAARLVVDPSGGET